MNNELYNLQVDMDMDEEDTIDASQGSDIKSPQESIKYQVDDFTSNGMFLRHVMMCICYY